VSLAVDAPGEAVALMGPSGSGKTTLLSILGGLLRPSSGSVRVDGTGTPVLEVVSWVHQSSPALGRRTALDNVVLGFLATGRRRAASREPAEELLGLVGLDHRADARAGTLSGGEVQRLGIARALARGAPFLLADEPTGQLDHATGLVVQDALFAGLDAGVSVIVATHDPEVAARCDRVLEVRDGSTHPRGRR
jgi:ABC-type lipoprotein export system ATPase subunit